MTSKSSGFTLIELLVVVAILGIIAAIGIVSYNGYVSSAKKRSAENVMQQISLGQLIKSNESKKALADHQSTMPPSSRMARTNILQGILGTLELDAEEIGH